MADLVFSAFEFRNHLGEILNLVYYQKKEIVIEKVGKPVAKVVPYSEDNASLPEVSSDINRLYGAVAPKRKKPYSLKEIKEAAKSGFVSR
jgi:prevent-host-death family protein